MFPLRRSLSTINFLDFPCSRHDYRIVDLNPVRLHWLARALERFPLGLTVGLNSIDLPAALFLAWSKVLNRIKAVVVRGYGRIRVLSRTSVIMGGWSSNDVARPNCRYDLMICACEFSACHNDNCVFSKIPPHLRDQYVKPNSWNILKNR